MKYVMTLFLTVLVLTGCGTTPQERGLSGAGIGAAAGSVVGAITGLSVLEAAALGATSGALSGIFVRQDDLDLGKPVWEWGSDDSRQTAQQPAAPVTSSTVAEVQQKLAVAGYDPGPIDGIEGPRTRRAIKEYQSDHNLLMDGRASPELLTHISVTADRAYSANVDS